MGVRAIVHQARRASVQRRHALHGQPEGCGHSEPHEDRLHSGPPHPPYYARWRPPVRTHRNHARRIGKQAQPKHLEGTSADQIKDMSNAMVPNSIPNLWISAGLSSKPAVLDVHGHAERLGFRKWLSWATAMDPSTNLPVVMLDGAVGTEISKGASEGEKTSIRSPYYSIDWKPDISTVTRSQVEALVRINPYLGIHPYPWTSWLVSDS